jgi:hypothetical protein
LPDAHRPKENAKWTNITAELIQLQSQAATDAWSAWRQAKVGGFISAAVRSAGTSDVVTVRRANMRQSMQPKRAIRSSPALSRVRAGSTITRRKGRSRVRSCFRRIRIRRINQRLDRQGKFQPIGSRCCARRRPIDRGVEPILWYGSTPSSNRFIVTLLTTKGLR